MIKKIISIMIVLSVFLITLELSLRAYFFQGSESWLKSLEHHPRTILGNWRGLPFEIPVNDGELVWYKRNDSVLYRVPFEINENSTRVSSQAEDEKIQDIIFIGCSFTFGAGVRDHETLSSFVGMNYKGARTHNYGVVGATSIETLLRLRKVHPQELPQSEKLVIYTYIGDHLRRHALVLPYVGGWGKDKQVFRRNGDEYEALGKFREVHPIRSYFYSFLAGTGIAWFLYPFFDLSLSEDDRNEFLTSIELMKSRSQFLGGKFLVLIWPGTQAPQWFIEGMEEKGITFLNLAKINLRNLTRTPYIPFDSHPTAEAYKVVGKLLISHLEETAKGEKGF